MFGVVGDCRTRLTLLHFIRCLHFGSTFWPKVRRNADGAGALGDTSSVEAHCPRMEINVVLPWMPCHLFLTTHVPFDAIPSSPLALERMGKKAKKKTGKKASKPKANCGAVVEARAVRDGSAAVASKLETGNKPAAKSPKETVDQLMNMMAEAGIDIKTRGDAALEAKKLRDELAVLVAKEEKEIADKGLGKEALKDVHLAHTLMGLATKLMAEGGIIEDEKHSSLTYCEEHRDELYRDGGAEFRRQLANAIKKAKTEAGLGAELESLLEMEQRKGLFKLLRNLASEIKAKQFDRSTLSEDQKKMIDEIGHLEKKGDREGMFRLIRKFDSMMQEGLPPEKRGGLEDMFLGTIIDDELFAPPPPSPDCPVCFLALPGRRFCTYQPCCGKVSCRFLFCFSEYHMSN